MVKKSTTEPQKGNVSIVYMLSNLDSPESVGLLALILLLLLPYSFMYLLFPNLFAPTNLYVFILYSLGISGIFVWFPFIMFLSQEAMEAIEQKSKVNGTRTILLSLSVVTLGSFLPTAATLLELQKANLGIYVSETLFLILLLTLVFRNILTNKERDTRDVG